MAKAAKKSSASNGSKEQRTADNAKRRATRTNRRTAKAAARGRKKAKGQRRRANQRATMKEARCTSWREYQRKTARQFRSSVQVVAPAPSAPVLTGADVQSALAAGA